MIFWPNINSDIQNIVEGQVGTKFKTENSLQPLLPHNISSFPWEKVGVDLMFFDNANYLFVTDYYSKYVENSKLYNYNADTVNTHFKSIFSDHGMPLKLVSDNGSPFQSVMFKKIMQEWDFEHISISLNYLQSNGQAESSVKIVKNILK